MSRTAVLQTLRLKGRASVDAVAGATYADPAAVADELASLVAAGLVDPAGATGFRLTADGREALAGLLHDERAGVDTEPILVGYEQFCLHNTEFKTAMTAWQLRDNETINDHSDAAYDDDVVARIGAVHQAARTVVAEIVAPIPRLAAAYPRRLDEAWAVVESGDRSWIAKPLADSFHTVWFELHEELIGLAGLTRADEAAAGRAE